MSDTPLKTSPSKSGFTLAELLLAMLVFAIAITTILALLARSIETVDEILLKDEAMRLSGAVENFFDETPFNSAYAILFSSNFSNAQKIHAYMYRGDPDNPRSDGTLTPVPSRAGTLNEDFIVTPGVRVKYPNAALNTTLVSDLTALHGRLFYVKLDTSTNPEPLVANPDTYPSAVVVVFAEFYPVPTLQTDVDAVGISPAYSYTFAVRR